VRVAVFRGIDFVRWGSSWVRVGKGPVCFLTGNSISDKGLLGVVLAGGCLIAPGQLLPALLSAYEGMSEGADLS
jgi:hypothetical protein